MNSNLARALLLAALVLPAVAHAGASVNIGVSDGPVSLELSFRDEPEVVYVPEQRVYVVRDHDCDDDVFRYSGAWWVVRDGRWYRSRTWRGPFAFVHERYVPAAIWRVPAKHWRRHPHGGPPGLAKKDRVVLVSDRPGVVVVKEKHGKGRGKSERVERRH